MSGVSVNSALIKCLCFKRISCYKMSDSLRLLVKNAKQVVMVCKNGEQFLTKDGMQNLAILKNASVVIGQ